MCQILCCAFHNSHCPCLSLKIWYTQGCYWCSGLYNFTELSERITSYTKGPWISIRNVGEQATSVGEETDLLVRERKRNLQVINELSRHLSGIENKEAQIKPFASKKIRRENVQEDVSKIRKGTIMMFHVNEYWCVSNHGNMIQKPSKQIGDLKTSKGIHNVWR